MQGGDRLLVMTPGGGGFGDPDEAADEEMEDAGVPIAPLSQFSSNKLCMRLRAPQVAGQVSREVQCLSVSICTRSRGSR